MLHCLIYLLISQPPPGSTLFPYTTLFRSFCGSSYGFGFSGCPVPKNVTSNAWPLLISKLFPTGATGRAVAIVTERSEEHTSELQSQFHLVCRLLLEKKKLAGILKRYRTLA